LKRLNVVTQVTTETTEQLVYKHFSRSF